MRRLRADRWWLVPIGLFSLVAHLWRLGDRPLAHDEAIDAWFSWQARTFGVIDYDPTYHGPLRFYLEGPVLDHLGTTTFHTRLVAAFAGVAATLLIAANRRILGRIGAPVAAVAFVVSPTALTVTRWGREDSLVGLVTLALLLLVGHALTDPKPQHVIGAGALLAVSFGLKETAFILSANAALFLAGVLVVAWRRPDGACRAAVRGLVGLGSAPWVWMLTAFAGVFMVVYTSGFRDPDGLMSGLTDGVQYWWSQHDVRRGSQPWFFYLAVFAGYEWLLLVLTGAGLAVTLRSRSLVGAWFTVMAVGQMAFYSWAGEKFAWLALHPLLPCVLLAGMGVQAIADHLGRTRGRVAVVAVGAALAVVSLVVAIRPAVTHGADARELLVTVQTATDAHEVAARLRAAQRDGSVDSILVDETGGASWPWVWYLHGLENVGYRTIPPGEVPTDADAVLLVAPPEPPEVPPGYTSERFRLRVWWVPDYDGASVGDLLRWFFTREVWSPTASYDQYLLLRTR